MKIKKINTIFIIILFLIVAIILIIGVKMKCITNNHKISNNSIIPRLYIIGNIEEMQNKEDKRRVFVRYENNDTIFESYALLKVQGSYTLRFNKKNYNITFYKDNDFKEKQSFDVKWGKYNKYTLKANWTDPLHSRNVVTAQIASKINQKYGILTESVNNGLTDGFPIEVYVNNEFLGLYTMNIHKDFLFNVDKSNKNNIVRFANLPKPTAFSELETEEWNNYEVEFGEKNKETLDKLNRLIDFINNSSDEEFVNNFEKYINLDSALNYYCFMKFAHLIDNVTRNFFLVTFDGEIWFIIPYDFDQSWGNEFKDFSVITDYANKHTNVYINKSPLWKRFKILFEDEITTRYKELRKDILTKENVLKMMNDFYKLIPEETLIKEHEKWSNKPNYERTYLDDYLDKLVYILDKELKKDE